MDHREPADVWARRHFGEADVSDVRRAERVITIAHAMALTPEASVPKLFAKRYDVKAAYSLFDHPEATPEALQFGHRQLTLDLMGEPGTYLLIEDTTSASWSGKEPIEGLGQIGNGAEGDPMREFAAAQVPRARIPALGPGDTDHRACAATGAVGGSSGLRGRHLREVERVPRARARLRDPSCEGSR